MRDGELKKLKITAHSNFILYCTDPKSVEIPISKCSPLGWYIALENVWQPGNEIQINLVTKYTVQSIFRLMPGSRSSNSSFSDSTLIEDVWASQHLHEILLSAKVGHCATVLHVSSAAAANFFFLSLLSSNQRLLQQLSAAEKPSEKSIVSPNQKQRE